MRDTMKRATPPPPPLRATAAPSAAQRLLGQLTVGLMAFLTVVDLFATQAVLPALAARFQVDPATMGNAVNACTLGMAAAGLGVALLGHRIDRRRGVVVSLLLLAVPTVLLAVAPDVGTFAGLRIVQGILMATAFSLTLAFLGDAAPMGGSSGAVAAYVTGNVASNLFGRLLSASVADVWGLGLSFVVFAALNLAGAALAAGTLRRMTGAMPATMLHHSGMRPMAAWRQHLGDPALRAAFAMGFCILFAFIGTFTYVNFVLFRPPVSLGMMQIGLVYFVFLPSILTTPLAGRLVALIGSHRALLTGFALALAGMPLLLMSNLTALLSGLVMVGIGAFLAQAIAAGTVVRLARADPASASGLYLASYFLGGLIGSAGLGQVFVTFGWPATVAGTGTALLLAAALAGRVALPRS